MSSSLVLSNVTILEGDDLSPVNGYLVIKDGKIEKISEGFPPSLSKDLKRSIIIPPFLNAHTHLGDSRWKELYIGKTQNEVVGPDGLKHKLLKEAKEDDLVMAMRNSIRSMLMSGTIGFCDFREGGLAGLRLLKRATISQIRSFILARGNTFDECIEVLREADGIGMPSLDFLPWQELVKVARETRRLAKIFSVHVSETAEAERKSIRERGEGELSVALKLRPSFLVHGTHSSREDLRKAKKKKVPVVFCPRANRLLSVGAPPISQALEIDLEFWLGSDNVCVCEPVMFDVLSSAWECVRLDNPRAGSEEARRLLISATVSPSKFFLKEGGIKEGKDATFVVLARRENLRYVEDIYAGIVNRADINNVRSFFVCGKEV
ncbi:MAG: amidohydrolase family protein [Candidatus Hadarchaeales archaeon]